MSRRNIIQEYLLILFKILFVSVKLYYIKEKILSRVRDIA
jgi:hypothetical protein